MLQFDYLCKQNLVYLRWTEIHSRCSFSAFHWQCLLFLVELKTVGVNVMVWSLEIEKAMSKVIVMQLTPWAENGVSSSRSSEEPALMLLITTWSIECISHIMPVTHLSMTVINVIGPYETNKKQCIKWTSQNQLIQAVLFRKETEKSFLKTSTRLRFCSVDCVLRFFKARSTDKKCLLKSTVFIDIHYIIINHLQIILRHKKVISFISSKLSPPLTIII